MGFFDKLINAFSRLFGEAPNIKYDDNAILASIRRYPQSFSDQYQKAVTEIAENIHQVYTAANNKEFTIGVIGDFTVGKSTFVNAILGDRILPVSANPTTAIITKIKYGNKPKVIIRYNDGSEEEMTYDAFMAFSAFNLDDFHERMDIGDIRRFRNVVDAVMYVKSEFLKENNLCIVDTLGLSAHERDNEKTIASIRDSIAIIYICGERGLSDKDEEFISTYLCPDNDDFFLCINRIDLVKKNERDKVLQFVKLKMDDILNKANCAKEFSSKRIFQVSSLYQEFANGFTDYEEYHEGINYQERSGFIQIMNDVCKHVNANADASRKEAINKQLQKSQLQLSEMMAVRKSEFDNLINVISLKIIETNKNIKANQDIIASINLMFEKLYNEIYSFSNNLYNDFSQSVNADWEEKLKKALVNQVSFGVGDYLALEKDILSLKLNVFKSMTDYRYARLESLSPFVNLTIQYLKDKLYPIIYNVESQIQESIKVFVAENDFNIFFDKEACFDCDICLSVTQNEVVYSTYRAVAIAATESTWVSNRNRRIRMFNAAKAESLKSVEKPLRNLVSQFYACVKQYLDKCNTKATATNVKLVKDLMQQIKTFENQNALLRSQQKKELSYFHKVTDMLNSSRAEKADNE
ncbi:MAG: dynamin family protein [Prevotella sp.]|nr:dynamin family protein [Prevotella sp.]